MTSLHSMEHMMTQQTRSYAKNIAVAITLAAFLPLLAGCSALGQSLADKWSVTYRVELSGGDTTSLESFEFLGKETAEAEPTITKSTSKGAPSLQTNAGSWSAETVVEATKEASITVTPRAGTTATCRILLDDTTELVSVTGKPGEPVTCSAETPKFPER